MITTFKVLQRKSLDETDTRSSADLANQLSLPTTATLAELSDDLALFELQGDKLRLHLLLDNKATDLHFDLAEGALGFRASRVSKSNELVAKAIGCKPHYRPRVLDATAGMGRDALVMALLGCEVVMFERNFAIFQLLRNALTRLKANTDFSSLVKSLSLFGTDCLDSLGPGNFGLDSFGLDNFGLDSSDNRNLSILDMEIDVVYLDPMFPIRKKTALVKKEMRLFKLLAGDDPDADKLLNTALKWNPKRVVVKRPKGARELAKKTPNHTIEAKKFRYDVYLQSL